METRNPCDAYFFYSCTIISFLESRADTYVENLAPFFEMDKDILKWLENSWLLEEKEHGRIMRQYVEKN